MMRVHPAQADRRRPAEKAGPVGNGRRRTHQVCRPAHRRQTVGHKEDWQGSASAGLGTPGDRDREGMPSPSL